MPIKMEINKNSTFQANQQWFQDSPHKEHYDSFIHSKDGFHKILNIILNNHSFHLPLPEKYVTSTKADLPEKSSSETVDKYSMVFSFETGKPHIYHTPIRKNKFIWNSYPVNWEDANESLTGYLYIKVPVTIIVSIQKDKNNKERELKRKKIDLIFRKFPLLDNKSIFWWGKPGNEIKRMPIGLIRYAPGPLLCKVLSTFDKDVDSDEKPIERYSYLKIEGELGDILTFKIDNVPFALNEIDDLLDTKGTMRYGNQILSISDALSSLDENLKTIISNILQIRFSALKQSAKIDSIRKTFPKIYLSELGRLRLENKLKALLGNDYLLFNKINIENSSFLGMREIAMIITGLMKNYSQTRKYTDDLLHLGNRRILLLHHLISRSINEGVKLAFNNPIAKNYRLPMDKLADDVCIKIVELLELSTIITQERIHKYIINATQTVDDTNPLSLLSQRRKITFCGPGGIKTAHIGKDMSIRDIHPSHYGRICIVETNEGKGVGLNLQLASMAKIRFNGEIETPYKMPNGQSKSWSAFEEITYETDTGQPLEIKFLDDHKKGKVILVHNNSKELNTITKSKKSYLLEDNSFIQPYGFTSLLVPFISHCDGTRAMMGAKNMKQALIPKNPESPIIQTGFEEILNSQDGTSSIVMDKSLGLGVNALVAYMPWKGFNFEDGIVCSESFANKMTTVHEEELICELFYGDKLIYQLGAPVLKPIGSNMNHNDIVFRVLRDSKEGKYIEKICSADSGVLLGIEKLSIMHPSVARFRKEPYEVYKTIISQERPLKVGDKIMGRHGNKGIISMIIPDNEMPKLLDGTSTEVILNPNGVISRMNLSQILETHWGWVAYNRKSLRNKPLIFPPFQEPSEKVLQNRLKILPDTDATGKVLLTYQIDGKNIKRPVVVGLQYIMKLNHLAVNKLKIRTTGRYNQLTGGAIKGKGGGQRIGEMEYWALRSYGANATISETYRIKNLTEKNKRNIPLTTISLDCIMKAMCMITNIKSSRTSYRLARTDEISSCGPTIKSTYVRKKKTEMVLSCKRCYKPAIIGLCDHCKSEMILSTNKRGLLEGECSCSSKHLIEWKCECGCSSIIKCTYSIWENEKDGLLDANLFGTKDTGIYLKQFGNIKLNIPVFNPLYVINITRNRDKKIIKGLSTYIFSTKKEKEGLKEIDFNNLSSYRLKSDTILTPVEALSKQFSKKISSKTFQKLTITSLPVIPLAFRDAEEYSNDLHNAYRHILEINEYIETTKKDSFLFKKLSLSLQRAVYKLFWGEDTLKNQGLTGRLQGRKGLLRTAMLARRVDFSARAVIVPSPTLHLDECILPEKMKTLFITKEYENISNNSYKRVLIHRAATLHKYNILSFKVKGFWDYDVVGLPPLVCSYMNADFDGDTVAVHIPLSKETYKEAARLMSPEKYLFGYANGNLMPHITQDIVLGLYLLAKTLKGRKKIADLFDLSSKDIKLPFTSSNQKRLCEDLSRKNANSISAQKLFELSMLGFGQATLSGATFSIFDIPFISSKEKKLLQCAASDEWRHKVMDKVQALCVNFAGESDTNGVAWLIVSGARGGRDQIVQLGGMRGSMFRPNGEKISEPVEGNFREGLKSHEYWISAPGTRKGMIDKHIKTQPAGILHRKLVETGYPLEIVVKDCCTKKDILIRKNWNIPEGFFLGKAQEVPYSKRIIGRTLNVSINLKLGRKKVKIEKGTEIDYALAKAMEEDTNIKTVRIRSPLLCDAKYGICSKCYGLSLDTLELQEIGIPVGIMAGHIIGERGVQLAMRTFHTGGASVSEVISGLPWLSGFFGAKKVAIPMYKFTTGGQTEITNRWNLLLLLINSKVDTIEEAFGKDEEELSINEFLLMLISDNKEPEETCLSNIYDIFLHVMSFETLSIYSGDVANIHFETLLKAMLTTEGTFNGISSQAGKQSTVLASASHERAIQKIFKAAIDNRKDTIMPWREKFIRGLI